jgi:hypothetical protein
MIRETSDIAVDKERFGHVNERAGDHRHDECWENVQCASASGHLYGHVVTWLWTYRRRWAVSLPLGLRGWQKKTDDGYKG